MNGDREIIIFPVQLTTSRIGNLTPLIFTLAPYDDHTYINIHTSFGYSVLRLSLLNTTIAGLNGLLQCGARNRPVNRQPNKFVQRSSMGQDKLDRRIYLKKMLTCSTWVSEALETHKRAMVTFDQRKQEIYHRLGACAQA